VGVADHVSIGDGAILTAKSGIAHDVPAGEVWSGAPARPTGETKRIWAAENRLPDLLRRVRDLEKRLTDLEKGAK
jgi:UDP-3-O-[3-hydroxymyristoyl] glucosamine N-acyltransferase